MRRVILIGALVAVIAVAFSSEAQAETCFGAPPGLARADFPQSNVFTEAQSWWLQFAKSPHGSSSDMLTNIEDAILAQHIHLGVCSPVGETIAPVSGPEGPSLPVDMQGKLHNMVGGNANMLRGGAESGTTGVYWPPNNTHPLTINWKPTTVDETRVFPEGYQAISRLQSNGCGLHEGRYTLNMAKNPFGVRQYQSFGIPLSVPCKPGQTPHNYRANPNLIFRGWYNLLKYVNVVMADESGHAYIGWHASDMDDPVPSGWTVKYSLAQGANKSLVAIDPDIHHGSYGLELQRSSGTGPFNVTIPVELLDPIVNHHLMIVGCEKNSVGQSCGVGVIPFKVG